MAGSFIKEKIKTHKEMLFICMGELMWGQGEDDFYKLGEAPELCSHQHLSLRLRPYNCEEFSISVSHSMICSSKLMYF